MAGINATTNVDAGNRRRAACAVGRNLDARCAAASPDLILSNGKIITVDERFTIAQAVAISGDRTAAATPFGLFFGRIANFVNAEIYGRLTDVPWAVEFPVRALLKGDQRWAAPPDADL